MIAAAAIALSVRPASADELGDLMKQGSQAYQDGRYDDAIAKLDKAYELSPKPEILFALAQAERLGGHCPAALTHYKKVLEKMTDLDTAKLIEGNVALCEKTEAVDTDRPREKETPGPTKTVVRVEHHTDKLALTSFAIGALGLGAAGGLYVASNATRDAAAGAPTLDGNHSLNSRADLERGMSYGAAGVGVALVTFAIYRWVSASDEQPPAAVAVGHGRDGTTFSLITRF